MVACHSYPVVSVQHEVRAAYLVEYNRQKLHPAWNALSTCFHLPSRLEIDADDEANYEVLVCATG
jgi:hypothetical protein